MSSAHDAHGGAARFHSADAILAHVTECCFRLDAGWRFVELNDRALRYLGQSREALLGVELWAAYPRLRGTALEEAYHRALRTGEPVQLEFRAPGQPRWADVHAFPRADGLAVYFRDITGRKAAERRLQLEERQRDQFLAMLAHELRNPLAAITGALSVVRRCAAAGECAVALEVAERQGARMARMIDDLLDVSRVTRRKVRLQRHAIDLVELLQDVADQVIAPAAARDVRIALALPGGPVVVRGDRVRLEQVFTGLLHNACKFSAEHAEVRVGLSRDGAFVEVRVEDHGAGIEPRLLPRIFNLFVQGQPAGREVAGGLGIGLTLARALVRLHGGTIEARSGGRGQGATFTVRLPAESGVLPLGAAPPRPAAPAPAARLLLLVDDNEDALLMLGEILRARGFEIACATTGREALARAAEAPPDVALLDIGLPDMDGYRLAETLHADPRTADTRLIAVTGFGQREDRLRAARAGFEAHLVKPVALDELDALLGVPVRASGGEGEGEERAGPAAERLVE